MPSVKGWLPNSTKNINASFSLSSQLSSGSYSLDTALVHNSSFDTLLPIAVLESRTDQWVPLGNINIQENSGSGLITSVTAASNTGAANNLIDGNNSTNWVNASTGSGTSFDLNLNGTYTLSSIDFLSEWDTYVIVEVDGQQAFSGWTENSGIVWDTINFTTPVTGSVITIKSPSGTSWLNVREVGL